MLFLNEWIIMKFRLRHEGLQPVLPQSFLGLRRYGLLHVRRQFWVETVPDLIGRFEQLSRDAVTDAGGRVVKMIGDAVSVHRR